MVRAPTIRGRPTPARKTKTKTISSTSSSLPTVHHPTKAVIPRALKRAERRANLLAKASDAENKGARALLKEGEYSISKSSIRRRKRKARDEIGKDIEQGRSGGVKEIMDVVDDLEMEFQANEEQEEAKGHKIGALPESRNLTANQRKRMLAQEQARQGIVLSDPAYKASPFEALRTHVRNTIAASSR